MFLATYLHGGVHQNVSTICIWVYVHMYVFARSRLRLSVDRHTVRPRENSRYPFSF